MVAISAVQRSSLPPTGVSGTMKRSHVLVLTTVAGAVLALLVSVVAFGQPGDSHKQARLSADEAIQKFREFVGAGTELTGSGPHTGKSHLYFKVEGNDASANVDAFDGTVRTLAINSAFPGGSSVRVTPTQATAAAEQFLSHHRVERSGDGPRTTLIDHGAFQEYLVEWQSRVNGALVPDYKSISVNPQTGQVFGYSNFERAYTEPPIAAVDHKKAEQAAIDVLERSRPWQVRSVELRVDFDAAGTQVLLWEVQLTDGASAALVTVDAMTALATVVGRG